MQDPEAILWGGESIYRDGVLVGFLTSVGYGHAVGGAVGLGVVERKLGEVDAPRLAIKSFVQVRACRGFAATAAAADNADCGQRVILV